MTKRVAVASVAEIPEGAGREFVAEGRVIAIFHVNGEYHALDGLCPHAGGPLGTGTLRGCIVTCPWHGWQFDVSTGKHCLSQTIRATKFPVHLDDDKIWVELPAS